MIGMLNRNAKPQLCPRIKICSSESGQKPSVYDHIEDTHIQPKINKKRNRNISNERIPIINAVFARFAKAPIMTYSIT